MSVSLIDIFRSTKGKGNGRNIKREDKGKIFAYRGIATLLALPLLVLILRDMDFSKMKKYFDREPTPVECSTPKRYDTEEQGLLKRCEEFEGYFYRHCDLLCKRSYIAKFRFNQYALPTRIFLNQRPTKSKDKCGLGLEIGKWYNQNLDGEFSECEDLSNKSDEELKKRIDNKFEGGL